MDVLQFSGGIDSLACLVLLRGMLDLTVATVLTDGAYGSTCEYLGRVQDAFPDVRFVVRRTKRSLKEYGHPVDVVPLRYTALGQLARGEHDTRYQDAYSCCNRAIWMPLAELTTELGATTIWRGQRNDDRLRCPYKDGDVVDGVTLRFPLATWTRGEVFEFVRSRTPDLMPPGYEEGEKTSRDCWDCTAYLQDNHKRISNLPTEQWKRVNGLLDRWREDVTNEMEACHGR